MPPKGPAPKKDSDPAEGTETLVAPPSESSADEEAKDTATEEATAPVETDVKPPDKTQREIAAGFYPEGTDLWYGEVHGLVFAFPRITGITPARQWLRAIYTLTEIAQTFEWMALAKVPVEMQNRTDLLTDEQYRSLFNAWFTDSELSLPK